MSGLKIAVLISGSGSNLQALIDSIESGKVKGEIRLVVSSKKGVFGLDRAEKNFIPTSVIDKESYPSQTERDSMLLKTLEDNEIELVVLAGYLAMVPNLVIEAFRNKIINIHPSLIPSFSGIGFYGNKVHKAVIERGVKITGATVHYVNEETDGGPIILQETVEVGPDDTVEDVQKKVLSIEHRILPYAVGLHTDGKLRVVGNRVHIINE